MDKIKYLQTTIKRILQSATQLAEGDIESLVSELPIGYYPKGSSLLKQGDHGQQSYFILSGCVQQYYTTPLGKIVTIEFFTEEQALNTLIGLDQEGISKYGYTCLEDTYLLGCNYEFIQSAELEQTPFSPMIRHFFYNQVQSTQNAYGNFKALSPEERFLSLLTERKQLIWKVPQHILASYLDISPETYSRYKKKYANKL